MIHLRLIDSWVQHRVNKVSLVQLDLKGTKVCKESQVLPGLMDWKAHPDHQ